MSWSTAVCINICPLSGRGTNTFTWTQSSDVSACAQLHYRHVSVPVPGVTWEGGREQEQEGLV